MKRATSFKDIIGWMRTALERCEQSGIEFTVGNCRMALQAINAPFISDGVLTRFGVKFSDVRRHLISGVPIEPKTIEKDTPAGYADDLIDDELEVSAEDAWDLLSTHSRGVIDAAEQGAFKHVEIDVGGPIGVVLMGDMHIGSGACMMDRIAWVTDQVNRSDIPLYIIQIGDLLDNMHWHAEEMAKGGSTIKVHVLAATHWLDMVSDKIIGLVSGNHDAWTHKKTGLDLLEHVMLKADASFPYHPLEMVLDLKVGLVNYRWVLRHGVQGSSQYNNAHGVLRWLMMHDTKYDADCIVAGHTHKSGYVHRPMHGRERHGFQLGAYKARCADGYAINGGWVELNDSPDMLAILYPDRKAVEAFEDTAVGIRVLESLWRAKESSKPSRPAKTTSKSKTSKPTSSPTSTRTPRSSSPKSHPASKPSSQRARRQKGS